MEYVKFKSLTGLDLSTDYIPEWQEKVSTISTATQWGIEAGAYPATLGPDPDANPIPRPRNPADNCASVRFAYKRFLIDFGATGPRATRDLFETFDSLLVQTTKRIDILRAAEEAEQQLSAFTGPKGIANSIQVKIDHFKTACKAFDYNRALNMIDALRNELKAQRSKQVPESLYQALSKSADEFETSTRFLMNPVLPSPPAPNGGQN